MSPQIEILEIILLFTVIALFSFGIAGLKLGQPTNNFFKYSFAGVLVLSFISLQAAIFTYIIKFDLYFGWNSALLILALTSIVTSPFWFKIIYGAKLAGYSRSVHRKKSDITDAVTPIDVAAVETPETEESIQAQPSMDDKQTELSINDDTKPFGITPDDQEQKTKSDEKVAKTKALIIEEKNTESTAAVDVEVTDHLNTSEKEEKESKTVPKKKAPVKKRLSSKRTSSSKHASKSKPRGKK